MLSHTAISPSYRIVARTKDKDDVYRLGSKRCLGAVSMNRPHQRMNQLRICSESENAHMNCPHVRSELFAPRADEKGIQWADELSACHARTLTVGLARSNFSLIGGMLGARLGPPTVQLVFE